MTAAMWGDGIPFADIDVAQAEVAEAQADALEQQWERDRDTDHLRRALTADGPAIPEPDRWFIASDGEATWALRMLAAARDEIDRIDAGFDHEILRLKQRQEEAKRQAEHDAAFFEARLIEYRRCLEAVNPKLPKTYKLPAGDIAVRAGRKSIKVLDRDAFIMWALDNRPSALSHAPLVSDLADHHREDGHLFDPETGERIPGVEEVTADPTYSVKVTTNVEPF